MLVTKTTVECLRVTHVPNLDPVTIYLEDEGNNRGKLTIECYGRSWTSSWGGMGGTLTDFVPTCDNHYLIGKLDSGLEATIYDVDQVSKDARAKDMQFYDDQINCMNALYEIYKPDGDPYGWQENIPTIKNHEYTYLERILDVVKQAIKEQADG